MLNVMISVVEWIRLIYVRGKVAVIPEGARPAAGALRQSPDGKQEANELTEQGMELPAPVFRPGCYWIVGETRYAVPLPR